MAGSFLISLLAIYSAVFSSSAQINKETVAKINCTHDGFLPHPSNCKAFYWCSMRRSLRAIILECDDDQIFDTQSQTCTYPWLSTREECGGILHIANEVEAAEDPSLAMYRVFGNGCVKNGYISNENDCTKFYRCVNNGRGKFVKYEFSCEEGTVWDPEIEGCNHPFSARHVKCGSKGESNVFEAPGAFQAYSVPLLLSNKPKPNNNAQQAQSKHLAKDDAIIPEPENECCKAGFLGHYKDCNKFYRCIEKGKGIFQKIEFNCGPGTVWDVDIDACNYPWATKNKCGNKENQLGNLDSHVNLNTPPPNLGYSTQPIFNPKLDLFGNHPIPIPQNYYQNVGNTNGYPNNGYNSQENSGNNLKLGSIGSQSKPLSFTITNGPTGNGYNPQQADKPDNGNNQLKPISYKVGNGYNPQQPGTHNVGSNLKPDSTEIQSEPLSYKISRRPIRNGFNHQPIDTIIGDNLKPDSIGSQLEPLSYKFGNEQIGSPNGSTNLKPVVVGRELKINNGNGYNIQQTGTPNASNNLKPDSIGSQSEPHSYKIGNGPIGNGFNPQQIGSPNDNNLNPVFTGSQSKPLSYRSINGYNPQTNNNPILELTNDITTRVPKFVNNIPQSATDGSYNPNQRGSYSPDADNEIRNSNTSNPSTSNNNKHNQSMVICTEDDFIPDPNDCKKFYRCVKNGKQGFIKYEFSCGEGTVWDTDEKICNHPANTRNKCGTGEQSTSLNPPDIPGNDPDNPNNPNPQTIDKPNNVTPGGDNQIGNPNPGYYPQPPVTPGDNIPVEPGYPETSFTPEFGGTTGSTVTIKPLPEIDEPLTSTVSSPEPSNVPSSSNGIQNVTSTPSTSGHSNSSQSVSNLECDVDKPTFDVCTHEGFMGDSKDCKKFYRCVNNGITFTRYEFTCGEGTIWDLELTTCIYPFASKRVCPDTSTSQQVGKVTPVTPETGGNTTAQTTTESILITPESKPDISVSSTDSSPIVIVTVVTPVDGDIDDEEICKREGFMADSKDCRTFYRCVSNTQQGFTKYEFTCGEGTIWDIEQSICNYPHNTNRQCTNKDDIPNDKENISSSTPSSSLTDSSENKPDVTSDDVGNGQSTTENELDVTSDNGNTDESTELSVSDSTIIIRPTLSTPENKKTTPDQTSTESTIATSTTSTETVPAITSDDNNITGSSTTEGNSDGNIANEDRNVCKRDGFMADSNDCQIFYRCVLERNAFTKYEFKCGDGTIWDSDLNTCNHPSAVRNNKCSSGIFTPPEQPSTVRPEESTEDSSLTTTDNDLINMSGQTEPPEINLLETTEPESVTAAKTTTAVTESNTIRETTTTEIDSESNTTEGTTPTTDSESNTVQETTPTVTESNTIQETTTTETDSESNTTQETTPAVTDSESNTAQETTPAVTNSESNTTEETTPTATDSESNTTQETTPAATDSESNTTQETTPAATDSESNTTQETTPTVTDSESNTPQETTPAVTDSESNTTQETTPTATDSESNTTQETTPAATDSESNTTQETTPAVTDSESNTTQETTPTATDSESNTPQETTPTVTDSESSTVKETTPTVTDSESSTVKETTPTATDSESSTVKETTPTVTDSESSTVKETTPTATDSESNTPQETTPAVTDSESNTTQETTPTITDSESSTVKETKSTITDSESTTLQETTPTITSESSSTDETTNPESLTTDQTSPSITESASEPTTVPVTESNKPETETTQPETTTSSTEIKPGTTMQPNPASTEEVEPFLTADSYCVKDGFFGNLDDCSKFYRCVFHGNGYIKYEFVCGPGTIWDPDYDTCSHPYNVAKKNCKQVNEAPDVTSPEELTIKPDTQTTLAPPGSDNQHLEDKCTGEGYYPSSQDCQKFFRCVGYGERQYWKFDFSCGEGTIYDPSIQTCNYPHATENRACGHTSSISSTTDKDIRTDLPPVETTTSTDDIQTTTDLNIQTTTISDQGTTEVEKEIGATTPFEETTTTEQQSQTTPELSTTDGEQPTEVTPSQETTTNTISQEITTEGEQQSQTTPSQEITTEVTTIDSDQQTQTTPSQETTTDSEQQTGTPSQETTTDSEQQTGTPSQETTTNNGQQTGTPSQETTTDSEHQTSTLPQETTTDSEQQTSTPSQETTTTESGQQTEVTPSEQTTPTSGTTENEQQTEVTLSEQTTPVSGITETEQQTDTTPSEGTTPTEIEQQTTVDSTTNPVDTTTEVATDSTTVQETTDSEQTTLENEASTITETSTVPIESTTNTTQQLETKPELNHTAMCPISQLEGDQIALVCPTGFKRHPKYCNLFYQCTGDIESLEVKILVLSCPEGTIYDDEKIQCVPPETSTMKCEGEIKSKDDFKTSIRSMIPMKINSDKPMCPTEGAHALNPLKCTNNFVKCERAPTNERQMRGYIHQCPEGFIYWPVSKQCECLSTAEAVGCVDKTEQKMDSQSGWTIPVEVQNIGRRHSFQK